MLRRSKLKDRFRIEKRFAVQAETFTQAMGMAPDTRSPVVVHHPFPPEGKYVQVLRLNELGTGKA